MGKTYSFQPLLNIGDIVYLIKYKFDAPNKHIIIESKINDIRYFCADNIIEYSTEDSDHFEGMGWYKTICFSEDKKYGEDFLPEDILFIRKEDAEKNCKISGMVK